MHFNRLANQTGVGHFVSITELIQFSYQINETITKHCLIQLPNTDQIHYLPVEHCMPSLSPVETATIKLDLACG